MAENQDVRQVVSSIGTPERSVMMRRTTKLPSFEGVASGQTATLRVPIGRTYHQIMVDYGSMSLSDMSEVRVVLDGETVHRYKGADVLDTINQYEGRAAASSLLVLDFDRYGLLSRKAQEFTALGTLGGVQTLAVEIDIVDSPTATPSLSARAVTTSGEQVGHIKQVRRFNYSPAGSGEYEISDLPTGGAMIGMIAFNSANIDQVELETDNVQVFNRTDEENRLIQSDGIRVPQSGWVMLDPAELGYGGEVIETAGVQDFRLTLHMSAADTVPVYVEYIAVPGAFRR